MIHQLASVHKNAKLGKNVVVEPFTTIYEDVEIGENTWIGPNVTIMDGARIGKNCKIFPGAVISAIPQDLKFKGEHTTLEVGDNTTIRECATLNRGTLAKGKTVVGSNCLIMAYTHIAHDCIIGNNCILVNSTNLAGEVEVQDWAIISGLTAVHQFVRIGEHVMIQGGSGIGRDVPPYVMGAHLPLAYVGINSIGLKRRGFSQEVINEIQDIYRVLFQSKINTTNAIEKITNEFPDSTHKTKILDFIKNSKRGIIKGFSS